MEKNCMTLRTIENPYENTAALIDVENHKKQVQEAKKKREQDRINNELEYEKKQRFQLEKAEQSHNMQVQQYHPRPTATQSNSNTRMTNSFLDHTSEPTKSTEVHRRAYLPMKNPALYAISTYYHDGTTKTFYNTNTTTESGQIRRNPFLRPSSGFPTYAIPTTARSSVHFQPTTGANPIFSLPIHRSGQTAETTFSYLPPQNHPNEKGPLSTSPNATHASAQFRSGNIWSGPRRSEIPFHHSRVGTTTFTTTGVKTRPIRSETPRPTTMVIQTQPKTMDKDNQNEYNGTGPGYKGEDQPRAIQNGPGKTAMDGKGSDEKAGLPDMDNAENVGKCTFCCFSCMVFRKRRNQN